jgi:hypothetical protein
MLYYVDEGVLARRGVLDGMDLLKGRAACTVLGGPGAMNTVTLNSDRELIASDSRLGCERAYGDFRSGQSLPAQFGN